MVGILWVPSAVVTALCFFAMLTLPNWLAMVVLCIGLLLGLLSGLVALVCGWRPWVGTLAWIVVALIQLPIYRWLLEPRAGP